MHKYVIEIQKELFSEDNVTIVYEIHEKGI